MRYDEVHAGEWVRPVKRGYRMACCDCGLVHVLDFEHIKYGSGRKIIFRAFRDNRATAMIRRHTKEKLVKRKAANKMPPAMVKKMAAHEAGEGKAMKRAEKKACKS